MSDGSIALFPTTGAAPGSRGAVALWCRWLIAVSLALLVYWPTFRTRPVFDDLFHVEFAAQQGRHLLHMGPVFFRPFERILLGLNWLWSGDNFWLVKLVAIAVLAAKAVQVHAIARRIVSPTWPWAPAVIALVFLLHPMHVAAVGKIDTVSEDLAALFALLIVRLAFVCADAHCAGNQAKNLRHLFGAAVLVLLGMLSKEAFAGVAAATPLIFAVAIGVSERRSRRFLVGLVALEAVVAVGYVATRHAFGFSLGAPSGAQRYQLHFGLNVLKNVAAELASISYPGSTLAVFVNLDVFHIAVSAALVAAFLVLFRTELLGMTAGFGRLAAPQRRSILIVLTAMVAALFPTCLIPELVSENQTALALPFVILLVLACPLGGVAPLGRLSTASTAIACLSGIAIVWMGNATSEKLMAAHELSVRAYRLGDQIVARYLEDPAPTVTACLDRSLSLEPRKYSIFSMPQYGAAEMQLYRLRAMTPAPVVNLIRPDQMRASVHCTLSIRGSIVTRD